MVNKNEIESKDESINEHHSKKFENTKGMSSFAGSYIMPYEKILFYRDLRTFGQKYLALIFCMIITLFLTGLFIVVGLSADDGEMFFGIAGVCFVIGAIVTLIVFLLRSIPELVLSDRRIMFFSGRRGNQLMEECPYEKLNGFQARKVRKLLPIVIGILLIIAGLGFITLGIVNTESETDTVETSPGVWEEVENDPDTIDYAGPLVFGAFLLVMGILILIFFGFMFNYVFKMGGGNIIVPCTGRKNRENATVINSIIMDMRRQG